MPSLNGITFTTLDVQTALIAKLNADQYVLSALGKNSAGVQNVVLDDDPQPKDIGAAEKTRAVLAIGREGMDDSTLGRLNGGTADVVTTLALLLYQFDGNGNWQAANKRALVTNTSVLRMALMRYPIGSGVPAAGGPSVQLWYKIVFPGQKDISTYYTFENCRFSVTMIEVYSRLPFT